MPDKPWPTVDDVATFLRTPLASLTPTEQAVLGEQLDAAIDVARVVPDWRTADLIPPRVWEAVRQYAARTFNAANAARSAVDTGDQTSATGDLWRLKVDMGYGRGARPRAR